MISLARCDDRLIHGQCMISVTKEYDIKRIIVVDDFTASNAILRVVFETAVPSNMKASCYTQEQAVNPIKDAMLNSENTLILMKTPQVYLGLRKIINGLPNNLNIGPMSSKKGAISVAMGTYLLPEEVEAIKELVNSGVHVYFKQTQSTPLTEWDELVSKFN